MLRPCKSVLSFILLISACTKNIPITKDDLAAVNVNIEEAVHKGNAATRITGTGQRSEELAILRNMTFEDGVIEADLCGDVLPGADTSFRGFIGVAFRLQEVDTIRYECFYLRPTNGRSQSQLRRNHSVQYISSPNYPWQKLRAETPGLYEAYADMAAGEWTHVKIEVKEKLAMLYVNHAEQPCLIINLIGGMKSGAVALWIGSGTDGYFKDLRVTKN